MNAPVDMTAVRIETERLILRAWRETDLADFWLRLKKYWRG